MPKNTKAPSVTAGQSSDMSLESTDSPTPEHYESLEEAMNDAGLGDGQVTVVDPPVVTDPPESEVDPIVVDQEEPEIVLDPAAEVDPAAPPVVKEPVVQAETPEEQEQKRLKELQELDLDKVTPPPNVSPRNLVNFDKLRETAKHFKAEASRIPELETKIKELETKGTGVLPAELQKELEDHRNFRRIFDAENDPTFKKQFEDKLSTLDEDLLGILKRNGLPEATAKEIQALGIDKVSSSWWETNILEKLPFIERERVQKRLAERADTVDQRSKEIESFSSKREEFLAKQQAEIGIRFETEQTEMQQHLDSLTKDIPWARFTEIPPKATATERKQIEAHNQEVAELQKNFQSALYPTTPQARAEIAAAAAASVRMANDLTIAAQTITGQRGTIDKLQKELDAIKSAGRLPSAVAPARRGASEAIDTSKLDDGDAIEQGLQEAEGL